MRGREMTAKIINILRPLLTHGEASKCSFLSFFKATARYILMLMWKEDMKGREGEQGCENKR